MGRREHNATPEERAVVRDRLMRYRRLAECAEHMAAMAAEVRERCESPSGSGMDGMPRAHGHHGLDDMAAAVVEADERAELAWARAEVARAEAVAEIDTLEDARLLDVCDRVYLWGLTIERTAESLGYSPRHVAELHATALDQLAVAERCHGGTMAGRGRT